MLEGFTEMGEPIQTHVGRRVRLCRKKLKLSQEHLAREVGVTAQAISRIEVGHRVPSLDLLVRLHKALGVSTDYLLTGKESPPVSIKGAVRAQSKLTPNAKRSLLQLIGELTGDTGE
ncbi:MAG: helix-turn-helix domain-containing protein [Solirubrobacteraceae bacterium]